MYLVIGKENCPQCEILTELFEKKSIRYCYVNNDALNSRVITYFKMYSSTYPIVLEIKNQHSFASTLEYFTNLD